MTCWWHVSLSARRSSFLPSPMLPRQTALSKCFKLGWIWVCLCMGCCEGQHSTRGRKCACNPHGHRRPQRDAKARGFCVEHIHCEDLTAWKSPPGSCRSSLRCNSAGPAQGRGNRLPSQCYTLGCPAVGTTLCVRGAFRDSFSR